MFTIFGIFCCIYVFLYYLCSLNSKRKLFFITITIPQMKKKSVVLASLLMLSGAVAAQKLSPNTELLLLNRATGFQTNTMSVSADNETISAFVKINSQTVLEQIERLGGQVNTNYGGNLVTVTMPIDKIRDIAALDDVAFIQASPRAYLRMDKAREDANVDACHEATAGMEAYTGKGIVIGDVDTGIEYDHIDYYDSARTASRLVRVWDQNVSGNAPSGFTYGTEYATAASIAAKRYDATEIHGGHVLGIAAGADTESGFQGVAPDAELVYVSMEGTSSKIVDGVKYIFDYAASVGKPCVVNLSLGHHQGPHDGTSETDQMLDALTGPGRIIVGAAGNEAESNVHVSKTISDESDSLRCMTTPYNAYSSYQGIDLWGEEGTDVTFKYVITNSSNGKIYAESDEFSTANNDQKNFSLKRGSQSVIINMQSGHGSNNRPEVMTTASTSGLTGNYKLGLIATSAAGTTLHAWQLAQNDEFTTTTRDGWTSPSSEYTVGEIGGTAKNVISVGSYNTKLSVTSTSGYVMNQASWLGKVGAISPFSSNGPTLDGRMKPDVSAPGAMLESAWSKYGGQNSYATAKTTVNGKTYYYGATQGTSMASPFVAGTVALWLQANPNLTPDDVKSVINATARHDEFTGDTANNVYGTGKIDTYAGLQYILTQMSNGITTQHATQGMFRVVSNAASHTAQVYFDETEGDATVSVYNTVGQQVHSERLTTNGQTLNTGTLTPGIYLFKLQRGSSVQTVKATL